MATLDVRLKKVNKVYKEGDVVAGVVIIQSKGDLAHQGVTLLMEGSVNLQLSAKSVGVFEAFYNSLKPILLLHYTLEVAKPGKFPNGKTEIPFEVPLKAKSNKSLYETYHGYQIKVDMKRSLLNKDLNKQLEFIVEYKETEDRAKPKPINFTITPETLTNLKEIVLESCETGVKSIEIQLVRVETCGCAEGFAKDATEIQNIQIADGDIMRGLPIPIFMIFPQFEVNVVIIFQDDHLVTENFPIKLTRY
ncbi:VP26C-like protein [Mya arenaria]|uniref:VP26C-like protein n=1 Tax=Mya arenaria TaxID=6604 RepID=A0ABY7E5N6_MYAAR|nr:VP26C-like protein [Mya arenaria]